MAVRILNGAEVERLLPMSECIDVMEQALRTFARGQAVLPLRTLMRLPDRPGLLGLMPAQLGEPACFGLKVVSVMPQNHGTGFDSHQGVVMLFEVEHGSPIAIFDGSSITAIRTAAVSGAATRALARGDAGDLAILGSGVQAVTHLEAMAVVRPLRRVRVWSRHLGNALAFAERESARRGIRVEVSRNAHDAVKGADLICTTTAAAEPVLEGAWLAEGAHLNAVGACFPAARELDSAAVRRARLYVDCRESALAEAGDFLIPRAAGEIGDDHIVGELGELFDGRVPGRTTAAEITLFKSLGIAVEDVAAAHHLHRKAEAGNVGLSIELGGRTDHV